MSSATKVLLQFGNCRYNPKTRKLIRDREEIPLQPKAAAILEYLIANCDHAVSRDELVKHFWAGINVTPTTLDYQIGAIRRALGSTPTGEPYITTRYGEGWQFTAEVREVAEAARPSQGALDATPDPAVAPEPAPTAKHKRKPAAIRWLAGSTVACAVIGMSLGRPNNFGAIDFVQLTSDARAKSGPILTDGKRLIFQETREGASRIVSVPVTGGDPVPLPIQSGAAPQDISPDGQSFIFLQPSDFADDRCAWKYRFKDASLELLGCGIAAVGWRHDGAISFVRHNSVFTREPGSQHETKLFNVPAFAHELRWSPDGRLLRLAAGFAGGDRVGLWEFADHQQGPEHQQHDEKLVDGGAWSRDGRYFFYHAGDEHRQDLWVEKARGFAFMRRFVRLTNGPGSWTWPAVGDGESSLFAFHGEQLPALVRFNPHTSQWEDMWGGSPDIELDYSPDRQWVAFIHQPDHTVWKSRADGTGRLRLTPEGFYAHQPHWSRDGQRIAYLGRNAKGSYRIFIIPASGGAPHETQPQGEDQGVPTWSSDDAHILFGERLGHRQPSEMSLHTVNVSTREVSDLKRTSGLWSPRWSPDGQKILAVTTDNRVIRISPATGWNWSDLISMFFVDNVTWSYDSRFIYFDGRINSESPFRVYRVNVGDGAVETLADLKNFAMPGENWWGVTPEGQVLASRSRSRQEVFELKCKLP